MDTAETTVKALAERAAAQPKRTRSKRAKNTRKKLEPLPKIHRRLMRMWVDKVAEMNNHRCVICGDTVKPNSHHIVGRETCGALRFDWRNGISLCARHHKFATESAHRNGVWFANWLRVNRPHQHNYVLLHFNDSVDLRDRDTLRMIEEDLRPGDIYDDSAIDVPEWHTVNGSWR